MTVGMSTASPVIDIRATSDSLWRELAHADNAADSITTLYHLYDLSERRMRGEIGMLVYDVASRTGNTEVQLDILRNNTNINLSSDSIMERYQRLAESLPENDDREETLTFIMINRLMYKYRRASEEERQEMMKELIKQYERGTDDSDSLQTKIRRLYELCVCLGITTQGGCMMNIWKSSGSL